MKTCGLKRVHWKHFVGVISLLLVGCSNPNIRKIVGKDTYVQGNLPHYLDMLLVVDASPSATTAHLQKDMRDSMKGIIEELNSLNGKFRIGVTTGAARLTTASNNNRPGLVGASAFGLDGSFTTSGSNSEFITEGPDAVTRFMEGVDKSNLLHAIRGSSTTGPFNKFDATQPRLQDYFGPISSIGFTTPAQSYSATTSFSGLWALGTNDENYFTAISRANQRLPGIFPSRSEVDVSRIPLVIMTLTDDTNPSNDQGFSNTAAENLIKGLRQHTIQGATQSNVILFTVVKQVTGIETQVEKVTNNLLNNASTGIRGAVLNTNDSFSNLVAPIAEILQEPNGQFCLSQRPVNESTLVVSIDGNQLVLNSDYEYDAAANCINIDPIPGMGQTISVEYQ